VLTHGRRIPVRYPFDKRGLGSRVSAVEMTDAEKGKTVLRFDPPCDIASDGAARIVLARDELPGGKARRLTIDVELPAATAWYPSPAEVPDEPGLDRWYPWQATGDTGASV